MIGLTLNFIFGVVLRRSFDPHVGHDWWALGGEAYAQDYCPIYIYIYICIYMYEEFSRTPHFERGVFAPFPYSMK